MFKDFVGSSPFVGSYSDNALKYVQGGGFNSDVSLTSTLRALLYNRVPHESRTIVTIGTADTRHSTPYKMYGNRVNSEEGIINIIGFSGGSDAFTTLQDDSAWAEYGYTRIEKITLFFRKSFHTLCYVNAERRNVVLIVENIDLRKFHFIQCAIPVFLPWYFEAPENKLNEREIRLIQSLAGNSYDEYMAALDDIYQSLNLSNLRNDAIRSMLNGYEKNMFSSVIQNLQAQIEQYQRDIENRFEAIREKVAEKEQKEMYLRGYIQTREEQNNNEVAEFFVSTKNVDVEDVSGDRITFIPYGYLSVWDDNEFHSLVDYTYSDLYEYGERSFSKDDRALIMRAIFEKKTLKIKVCAAYAISPRANRKVNGLSGYVYPGKFAQYMRNPHIDEYSCLGNYEYSINEAIANGNIIMAVELTVMSSKSLNLSDGAVMKEFYRRLFREDNVKFIELPDGTAVTTREAINWLKQQEGNEE